MTVDACKIRQPFPKIKLSTEQVNTKQLTSFSPAQYFNPFGPAIGEVKALFSCTYSGKKGDLYVATRAICFRHTVVFGFEGGREVIPWNSVRSISRTSNKDFHNGVTITRYGSKTVELRYLSASIDQSIQLFRQLWKNERLARRPRIQRQGQRDILCEILSLEGFIFEEVISGTVVEDDKTFDTSNKSSSMQRKLQDTNRTNFQGMHKNDKQALTTEALAWENIRCSKNPIFSETPVLGVRLECNLDEFFYRCLADDAPLSIVSFHRNETEDCNVSHQAWKLQDDGFSFIRTITYTYPVKIPGLAPSAEVVKMQVMRKYGDHGICISTTTSTKGVPVSDCFCIEDRIIIDSQSDGGLLISIAFDLRFVKYTMLRRIVDITTKKDINEFHRAYIVFLQRELNAVKNNINGHDITQAPLTHQSDIIRPKSQTFSLCDSEVVQMGGKDYQFQSIVAMVSALLFIFKFTLFFFACNT